jgi:viologen exporter family transport system permease protein
MTGAAHHARLFWVQARASLATALQYRVDFLIEGGMSIYWLFWNIAPLLILFDTRPTVAGWDFPSALIVIAWFTVLRAFLEGAINPSLVDVVERIRTGSFDYVLLKPADTQFLVSTARFAPWRLVDIVGGIALMIYAFHRLGRVPSAGQIAAGGILLVTAILLLYSLWILIVSASFWVVRLDNLAYLFTAVFDAARWPIQVFPKIWRFLFTFIVPLALMTTYPAMALLGRLAIGNALLTAGGAILFFILARLLWQRAIGNYTSASS